MNKQKIFLPIFALLSYKLYKEYMDETYYKIKPKFRLSWLSTQHSMTSQGITILIFLLGIIASFLVALTIGHFFGYLLVLIFVLLIFEIIISFTLILYQEKYCNEKYVEMT